MPEDDDESATRPLPAITASDFQIVSDARPVVAVVQQLLTTLANQNSGTAAGHVLQEAASGIGDTIDNVVDRFLAREMRL